MARPWAILIGMETTYTGALAREVRAEMGRQMKSGRQVAEVVADAGGVAHRTVARMIRGERPWDVDSLSLTAEMLGVSVSELIRRADEAWQQVRAAETRCTRPLVSLGSSSLVSDSSWALA